jgi:GNAT superfamily N-acetyltransferase
MSLTLAELCVDDLASIAAVDGGPAWKADRALWTEYLADHHAGRRFVLLALDQSILAYGTLLWESCYEPFRVAKIPEINNLVVAEQARRHGVATAMIGEFERRARVAGRNAIGLGVGLLSSRNAATALRHASGCWSSRSRARSHSIAMSSNWWRTSTQSRPGRPT